MRLASILIYPSEDGERPAPSALIQENIESLKARHPGMPHKLFYEQDIVELLQRRFQPKVLQAYRSLKPYAYRADLARLCILYQFGGIYSDLSYYFVNRVPFTKDKLFVFRDKFVSAPWDTCMAIIYAPPRHKGIGEAIRLILRNVERRYYGATDLCPTGPALFGKALATACEAEDLTFGWASSIARDEVTRHLPDVYVPDLQDIHCLRAGSRTRSQVIALKRKRNGSNGLGDLGMMRGNTYDVLWNSRDVYA